MAAKYLEKTFGTPYEIHYPLVEELLPKLDYTGKKVLVVHQQVIADSIRRELLRKRRKDRPDSRLVYDEKRTSGRRRYVSS